MPLGSGEWGTTGDAMDRYMMRIREMVQSSRILRQALKQMPEGPVLGKVVRNFKPAAGECQIRVESARGATSCIVERLGDAGGRLRLALGVQRAAMRQQPGMRPRRDQQPARVLHVRQAVAVDAGVVHVGALQAFARHRLHRIAPDLGYLHCRFLSLANVAGLLCPALPP